jgi:hypothetical protein
MQFTATPPPSLTFEGPPEPVDSWIKHYWLPMMAGNVSNYIENVAVRLGLLWDDRLALPVTIANGALPKEHSYIASARGQYLDYPLHEIAERPQYSRMAKVGAGIGFRAARLLANWLSFERVVFVNNWLLSTNAYPVAPDAQQLKAALNLLLDAYPGHTIIFRGIVDELNPSMAKDLTALGAFPVLSRQIYLLDPALGEYKKKRPFISDSKHYDRNQTYVWEVASEISEADTERALSMYRALYLDKYSRLNPQYTARYIQLSLASGFLSYELLRNRETGLLVAVQAVARAGNQITTPFIGHDAQADPEAGFYRLMNIQLTRTAVAENRLLNMSSGAGTFKKQRGGLAAIEYNLVVNHHLPAYRRLPWQAMAYFSRRYALPALQRMEI